MIWLVKWVAVRIAIPPQLQYVTATSSTWWLVDTGCHDDYIPPMDDDNIEVLEATPGMYHAQGQNVFVDTEGYAHYHVDTLLDIFDELSDDEKLMPLQDWIKNEPVFYLQAKNTAARRKGFLVECLSNSGHWSACFKLIQC